MLQWLRSYDRRDLGGDLAAGLTTAVMLVPQGMAYAMLAGLPPIVGLYASFLPGAIYALTGTSRQLSVGPVAMDSLLVASTVGLLAPAGSAEAVSLALTLALLVGVVQLAMGALKLGALVELLSQPVLSGFTSAAALIIGVSQLGPLLGVQLPRSTHVLDVVVAAGAQLGAVHLPSLLIGGGGIVVLVTLKRLAPRVPAALVVVVAATLAVKVGGLEERGVAIVGEVPAGLPPLSLPTLDLARLQELLPASLTIALVAFLEAISVGRAMAIRSGARIDANREWLALGAANVGASLSGGYPVTGGLSRTAVNASAGARTPLAALVTSALIAVVLWTLTPAFHDLPRPALASIVVVAVASLVDVGTLRRLWRPRRQEAWLLLLAFAATLVFGIQPGIAVGVLASLAHVVWRSTRPHIAELGQVPGSVEFRNIERHPEVQCRDGVVVLRVDMSLLFANIATVEARMLDRLGRHPEACALVLDCSAVNDIDATAARALAAMGRDLRAAGVTLRLARVKGPIRDVLEAEGACQGADALELHDCVVDAVWQPLPQAPAAPDARTSPLGPAIAAH